MRSIMQISRKGTFWFLVLLFATSLVRPGSGQDYLGVLPELMKPEVAERLGLSEEQRDQIRGVVRSRSMAAVGLAAQLDEAPLDQQGALRADFGRESERLAFELLSAEQKSKVEKFRVESMGMLALEDAEVAKELNLADWQQEVIAEWRKKVQRNRRGPAAEQVRDEAERDIRSQISDSQYEMWRFLAGQISDRPADAPSPPDRQAPDQSSPVETVVAANEVQPAKSADENAFLPVEDILLEINFQDAPWSEVIKWLAAQADLSLQTSAIPPGTFTYRDRARKYPVSDAMDIINGSMLSTGHQLIRSGRILRCIDFESIPDEEIRGAFIREIADVVDDKELQRRGDYEPVTRIFSLVRLDPTEVKEDVDQLLSIQGTATAISSTGDLIVTDMARNVRAIRDMIERAEDPATARGSAVQTIPLKHITADEILMAARPLLGLEEEVNTSDEISISTTLFGTTIFAKGDADKVQILRDLVKQMDVAPEENAAIGQMETPEIRRHKVLGTDLELAYQIASQMLAGSPEVRLAKDESASQLVLQARPSEHQMIAKMLTDLQGETSDFQVIQLEKLDPQLAIAAIKKFFNLTDSSDGTDGSPVIDGDLLARQVWVKGSATQVSQIRQFLDNLEQNTRSTNPFGDKLMQIPLTGRSAERALEQAQQMWEMVGGGNRIRILTPGQSTGGGLPQKSLAPNTNEKEAAKVSTPNSKAPVREADRASTAPRGVPAAGRFVTAPQTGNSVTDELASPSDQSVSGGEIVVMQGPNGLIVSSEDPEALARFQEVMNMLASQAAFGASDPTVIYLKNIKADAAKELLETIMSGTSGSSDSGGLLGGMASSVLGGLGGGMFGAMLGGGGGSDLLGSSSGLASGDYTITADPRLNALVI
ncbi:MAG: hypothetical protein NXI32_20920, partial [bacterium]|nr:hypothetical protein [bacterium]